MSTRFRRNLTKKSKPRAFPWESLAVGLGWGPANYITAKKSPGDSLADFQ